MLVYDLLQYFPLYETSRPIRAVAQWDMIRTGIGADAKYFVDAPSFHETKTFTVICSTLQCMHIWHRIVLQTQREGELVCIFVLLQKCLFYVVSQLSSVQRGNTK